MVISSSLKCVHNMVLKHKWLKEASLEFESALEYVHREFGEHSVQKVYSEVSDCIKVLKTFPDAGLRYKDLSYKGKEVRIFHMKRSSVIYCHDEQTLFILAFWNNYNDDTIIADVLSGR